MQKSATIMHVMHDQIEHVWNPCALEVLASLFDAVLHALALSFRIGATDQVNYWGQCCLGLIGGLGSEYSELYGGVAGAAIRAVRGLPLHVHAFLAECNI